MKTTLTITERGVITLPVEMYSDERLREFDAAEAELAAMLDKKSH